MLAPARLFPSRKALALTLSAGMSLLAVAGCGSESSTSTSASTATSVKKEAGALKLDVHLTVFNDSPNDVSVDLCPSSEDPPEQPTGCEQHTLAKREQAEFRADGVQGSLHLPDGDLSFSAANPIGKEPYFLAGTGNAGWKIGFAGQPLVYMVEGEVQERTVNGHVIRLERQGDSDDYKEMRLIVLS
jgi:hypothetical protein